MKKSESIKLRLLRNEHIKDAMKVHDSLVLQWLKCLQAHKGQENQAIADEYGNLEVEWMEYCKKKNFIKDAQMIFHDTIQRIVEELNKQGNLKIVK